MTCDWIVREGKGVKYWAFTSCKKGFNPLTKATTWKGIEEIYNGVICPICGKIIHIKSEESEV